MMAMAMMLAAATMAVGLQKAATPMTGQQKMTSVQRVSALANMSPEEKKASLAEHERVGKVLAEEFGFGMGKEFASYKFEGAQTNVNLVLPRPALGFTEFLPIVTEERLCGLYLKQVVPRDEKGRFSRELFDAARETSRTNLAERLTVRVDDLGLSTNDVPHVWRISYEQWREKLVLRICDEELSLSLLVAAEERRHGIWRADRAFGDAIFLVNPGIQIVPSDMGLKPLGGMHGFDPEELHSQAAILSTEPIPEWMTGVYDYFKLMKETLTKE